MRVAVLSDIHSNLRALDAILARIGAVDEIWHLGDVVGYGPDPDAVVGRLRELGARGVQGNHDLAATGDDVIQDFNPDARSAMDWTRREISTTTLGWLAALPARLTIGSFNLAHGSPRDPTWEYILSSSAAAANLAIMPTAWACSGTPTCRGPTWPPRRRRRSPAHPVASVRSKRSSRQPTPAWPWPVGWPWSTRAAWASRATATRPRAAWSSTPTGRRSAGSGPPTTSRRPSRRCARPACLRAGSSGWPWASKDERFRVVALAVAGNRYGGPVEIVGITTPG